MDQSHSYECPNTNSVHLVHIFTRECWLFGDSGVWFGVASFPADNFMVEILALLCVWTQHSSRNTDSRWLHVCRCVKCVSVTVCVSGYMSEWWWAGSKPCPSGCMTFPASHEWVSFSPEANDNSTANPEEQISHTALLPVSLSGHITLLLLGSLWVMCVFLRTAYHTLLYWIAFIFIAMLIVILQQG